MAEELYVVRHGQRRDSVDHDWAASADRVHDPPLTELGRWAAWRVGRRFAQADTNPEGSYASPVLRTHETADEICRGLGATIELVVGLCEHRNPE